MPDREVRLLALDGGGVRGLSALMILRELMEKVNSDSPPNPCDYFDLTGGTSTGGFVCATSKETSETVCLTSYKSPRGNNDLLNSVKIWEACRATSAASSFFDPIAIGRFKEGFVDGGAGANNPVWEVWNQAQELWGVDIHETLIAIATETERTAERFRRDKSHLDENGRFYRFNVARGLEDIGLEESKKKKEIAAATRRYVASQDVFKQMQACAGNITGREYFGQYRSVFSLEGVPRVSTFVSRPVEMAELERLLLPRKQKCRQRIYVVHGLGGMGKTQLAVEFARRHHQRFSSVFWLDGRSENSLKRSIANCARRIPEGQIPEMSRGHLAGGSVDVDLVVAVVMGWLSQADNTAWLLIFDNVDREFNVRGGDPDAYDVKRYLSGADHGSVLITTRLARLEYLGNSQQLGRVDRAQAEAIFQSWYKKQYDKPQGEHLFSLLEGLPLAIAQAGAFLQESGVGLQTYLKFYKQQWKELVASRTLDDSPLQDYPNRNIWTTWAISYEAIREKDKATANLLLLWSFLDNKDLWHGMFAKACRASTVAERSLVDWIEDIANNELRFTKAMQLLRDYSLIEDAGNGVYATHPVVHKWAYHYQEHNLRGKVSRLAVLLVGGAVSGRLESKYWSFERRFLPHAQACSRWVFADELGQSIYSVEECDLDRDKAREECALLDAIERLGILYSNQGQLNEAAKMRRKVLEKRRRILGEEHPDTIRVMSSLAITLDRQGQLVEAGKMHKEVLEKRRRILGEEHLDTIGAMYNLASALDRQGQLVEAGKMHKEVLEKRRGILGDEHPDTIKAMDNLAITLGEQGQLGEAAKMQKELLENSRRILGDEHPHTIKAMDNLAIMLDRQGQLVEAEKMKKEVLEKRRRILGEEHPDTIRVMSSLAITLDRQGQLVEAGKMHKEVLEKRRHILGEEHLDTIGAMYNLASALDRQGQLVEAGKMLKEVLEKRRRILGEEHLDTIGAMYNLASALGEQGQLVEAGKMHKEVLEKRRRILGEEHLDTIIAMSGLANTLGQQGQLGEAARLQKEVLKKRRRILGEEHLDTIIAMSGLAITLKYQGQLVEAAKMEKEVLEKRRCVLGEEHLDTIIAMSGLAITLKYQGQLVEAAKMEKEVLEKRRCVLGEEHLDTIGAMYNLASTLDRQGQLVEAEKMKKEALEKRRRILGEEHPDTIWVMSSLAITLNGQGQLVEAAKLQKEVLEKRRRILGEEHLDTIIAISGLANTLGQQGQLGDAAKMQKEVLEKRRRILGQEHLDAIKAIYNLANTRRVQGQLDEAAKMLTEVLVKSRRILGEEHPDTIEAMYSLAITLGYLGQTVEAAKMGKEMLETSSRCLGEEDPLRKLAAELLGWLADITASNEVADLDSTKERDKGDSLYSRIKGKFRRKSL